MAQRKSSAERDPLPTVSTRWTPLLRERHARSLHLWHRLCTPDLVTTSIHAGSMYGWNALTDALVDAPPVTCESSGPAPNQPRSIELRRAPTPRLTQRPSEPQLADGMSPALGLLSNSGSGDRSPRPTDAGSGPDPSRERRHRAAGTERSRSRDARREPTAFRGFSTMANGPRQVSFTPVTIHHA